MAATEPGAATPAPTLDDAIALATRLHEGQLDKAGESYIGHPLRVLAKVTRTAATADVDPHAAQVAAVLHDVVEDSELTVGGLVALGYPPAVVAAVDALSKRPGEATEVYLARVAADKVAVVVKHADMADNGDPSRLARLPPEQAERYRARYHGRAKLLDDLVAARHTTAPGTGGAGVPRRPAPADDQNRPG